MRPDYCKKILAVLKKHGKPVSYKKLLNEVKGKKFDLISFSAAVQELERCGQIVSTKGKIALPKKQKTRLCRLVRVNRTFGFAKDQETEAEYFIPGKFLMGAMPGDLVSVEVSPGSGNSDDGRVVEILEENFSRFTGNIVVEYGYFKVVPDSLSKFPMALENAGDIPLKEGDKVLAEVVFRGKNHSSHICRVVSVFGSSLKASVCALSVLELNGVTPLFPDEVIAEAKAVSRSGSVYPEVKDRTDLRDLPIFTIDGADTKDIDDAISIERTAGGYKLGVHIADVSHYVVKGSALDQEAFRRGTSIYYADRVIPMLPKELSNGICSLNPNEDRLAFSCLMDVSSAGEVTGYRFEKTVIRSRVKGVYSEVNDILSGKAGEEILHKYSEVADSLPLMKELSDILYKNRIARGAPQLETPESKMVLDENGICVDVLPKSRGRSEEIIEDFMLLANQSAARFGKEKFLPFVYRIHEDPPEEKISILAEELASMNIPFAPNGKVTPALLSGILERAKGTSYSIAVNNLILRSMSKAKYSTDPIGHFGLVLEDYAHFTSPIRRYPDLSIHRIMSAYLQCGSAEEVQKKFGKFAVSAAERSTSTEISAVQIERSCEDCYKAEYMKSHLGEIFDATIISAADFGVFAMLENTCEGLIRKEHLPDGEYVCSGSSALLNTLTGQVFKVGDRIKVQIAAADVSSGKVDMEYVQA